MKPEFVDSRMICGTAIHKALEVFYLNKMMGDKLPLNELQVVFAETWSQKVESCNHVRYKKGTDFESVLDEGKGLLESFYSQAPIEEKEVILALEEPFSFEIKGIPVPVIGIWDKVSEDEYGNIVITDFKTAARAFSDYDIDENFQLSLYHMGAKSCGYAGREVILRFDTLIKTKEPKFMRFTSTRFAQDHLVMSKKIKMIWAAMEAGNYLPASENSWMCSVCQYKSHCEKWFLS